MATVGVWTARVDGWICPALLLLPLPRILDFHSRPSCLLHSRHTLCFSHISLVHFSNLPCLSPLSRTHTNIQPLSDSTEILHASTIVPSLSHIVSHYSTASYHIILCPFFIPPLSILVHCRQLASSIRDNARFTRLLLLLLLQLHSRASSSLRRLHSTRATSIRFTFHRCTVPLPLPARRLSHACESTCTIVHVVSSTAAPPLSRLSSRLHPLLSLRRCMSAAL